MDALVLRRQLVAEAVEWIDTPFKHNQSVKGIGADCVGVVRGIGHACGIQFADVPKSYSRRPDGQLPCYLGRHLVTVSEPLPGDVLLIAFTDEPSHVALFIGNDEIVHAYAKVRRCIRQSMKGWETRIRAVYSFRELSGHGSK